MEPTNKLDKYTVAVYTVAVKGNEWDVIGHLPFGKLGKIERFLVSKVW